MPAWGLCSLLCESKGGLGHITQPRPCEVKRVWRQRSWGSAGHQDTAQPQDAALSSQIEVTSAADSPCVDRGLTVSP